MGRCCRQERRGEGRPSYSICPWGLPKIKSRICRVQIGPSFRPSAEQVLEPHVCLWVTLLLLQVQSAESVDGQGAHRSSVAYCPKQSNLTPLPCRPDCLKMSTGRGELIGEHCIRHLTAIPLAGLPENVDWGRGTHRPALHTESYSDSARCLLWPDWRSSSPSPLGPNPAIDFYSAKRMISVNGEIGGISSPSPAIMKHSPRNTPSHLR